MFGLQFSKLIQDTVVFYGYIAYKKISFGNKLHHYHILKKKYAFDGSFRELVEND